MKYPFKWYRQHFADIVSNKCWYGQWLAGFTKFEKFGNRIISDGCEEIIKKWNYKYFKTEKYVGVGSRDIKFSQLLIIWAHIFGLEFTLLHTLTTKNIDLKWKTRWWKDTCDLLIITIATSGCVFDFKLWHTPH